MAEKVKFSTVSNPSVDTPDIICEKYASYTLEKGAKGYVYIGSKKRKKEGRKRQTDCVVYIRSGYRERRFPMQVFFPINIDPIHIGRAVNSAIPRDVCLSFGSASKFIDRGVEDFGGRREIEIKLCAKSWKKELREREREKSIIK